jgi:mRNA interferase MazF
MPRSQPCSEPTQLYASAGHSSLCRTTPTRISTGHWWSGAGTGWNTTATFRRLSGKPSPLAVRQFGQRQAQMVEVGHGQIWWADLDKIRPVVVLTRAHVVPLLTKVLVAPISTTVRHIPTEVALISDEGVREGCVANLDNAQLIPVRALVELAGTIRPDRWPLFCKAISAVLDC